jgi:hypothetical protein
MLVFAGRFALGAVILRSRPTCGAAYVLSCCVCGRIDGARMHQRRKVFGRRLRCNVPRRRGDTVRMRLAFPSATLALRGYRTKPRYRGYQMRIAIAALLLAGCASPQQQSYNQEQMEIAYTQGLARQCESIGYQRNTDPWRQCILQLHAQNQNRATAFGAAAIQGAATRGPTQSCASLPPGLRGYARAQGSCY